MILRHDEAQCVQDVLPSMLHALLAVLFLFSHKAQRMEGEEPGVLLTAVSHPSVHPCDTALNTLKLGHVARAVKDLTPDAFHSRADQISLGIKIVVDGADRHPAGRRDRPNTDR